MYLLIKEHPGKAVTSFKVGGTVGLDHRYSVIVWRNTDGE